MTPFVSTNVMSAFFGELDLLSLRQLISAMTFTTDGCPWEWISIFAGIYRRKRRRGKGGKEKKENKKEKRNKRNKKNERKKRRKKKKEEEECTKNRTLKNEVKMWG